MNKELKKLLVECSIKVKWYNINEWVVEKFTNLLELCENENIKISSRNGILKISYNYGQMRVIRFSNYSSLENDLVNLYAQKCIYLGDKFKIVHRLKDYSN